MSTSVFSRNGELLPAAEAVIPLSNIEYAYGFGVYETVRSTDGKARFLEDHLDRLFQSADIIELRHPYGRDQIRTWISGLLDAIGDGSYNLKILLIGARKPEDCLLFILPLSPLFPDRKLYRDGATAMTFPHERMFPQAKILNMFPSYYAYSRARGQGHYDALFVNRDGNVTEGTRTNVLGIRGKTLVSPPEKQILEGVMRKHVLECAKANGYDVSEEDIPLSSLKNLDGLFLTSTSSKILPLRNVDEVELAIPEALKELMKAFDLYVDGQT